MTDAALEAVVESAFELRGQGTVLVIDLRAGRLTPGDAFVVESTAGNSRVVRITRIGSMRAVDRDGRVRLTLVPVVVDGIASDEVALGQRLVRSSP